MKKQTLIDRLDQFMETWLSNPAAQVGKRGSGKSNTAARFVEQLHRPRRRNGTRRSIL